MEIPVPWQAALAAVQKIQPAILAGGCLRDLHNEREVKDLDIFGHGSGVDELVELHQKLVDAGFDCAEIDTDSLYPVGDGNDLTGYIDITVEDCPPVQVVMVDWPLDNLLERFDYGICRIQFDGTEVIYHTHYHADRNAQQFRLRRPREGHELSASVHRFARLTRKYEGWSFVPYDDLLDDFAF
jgi:hypothetical protein